MNRHPDFVPNGVIPAVLLPFEDDFSIDEKGFQAHLADVCAVDGLSAITLNAHSTEVGSCTFEEQQRVLALALDAVGERMPIVNGVYAEGSFQAAKIAKMASDMGASALLVFPPGPFTMGHNPRGVIAHYRRIADVTDLPLIAFQYAETSPQSYPLDTLTQLCDAVPTVRAIKDWITSPALHNQQIEVLQSRPTPVNVLSTHSAWLYPSLVMGCKGLLSGSGSVIADLQAQLFAAVQHHAIAACAQLHKRITFTADVFYARPWIDMHNRMKEALVMMGRFPRAVVRPPLVPILADERSRIRHAMQAAGLLD